MTTPAATTCGGVGSTPADGTVVETQDHPLNCKWVLWEHKQLEKDESWSNSLREICEFATIEEFWKYWSFIPRPRCIIYAVATIL